MDNAAKAFLAVDWPSVRTTEEARAVALRLMDDWDWQNKVPEFRSAVEQMESIERVQIFLWRAISNGMRFKGVS